MNMLMIAPLCDSRGQIRYFIGAQVDVSGLVKDCTELESFHRLVADQRNGQHCSNPDTKPEDAVKKDEFQELSEMLNMSELTTVKNCGGRMHRENREKPTEADKNVGPLKSRLLLKEPSPDFNKNLNGSGGKLSGVYQHVSFGLSNHIHHS